MSFLELAADILPDLLRVGTIATLQFTIIAISIGFVLGLLLAFGKIYGNRPIRLLCSGYVGLIRGTPLITQLFVIHFGLPTIGLLFSPFLSAIIGLGLNSSAYQAEYFRGAIQSVNKGQAMAARSIGMTKIQAARYIILPQALRLVIPSWSNELIALVQYSSLVFLITAPELLFQAQVIAARNFRHFEVFLIAAFIYLVIVLLLSWILRMVEKQIRIPGLGMTGHTMNR